MNPKNTDFSNRFGGSFISDIFVKIRLVIKLVQDDRVDLLLKAIPAFCLLYLIVPLDLLIGPLDDALVLYLGMDFFINLCPQEIVNQYLEEIRGTSPAEAEDVIINGEFKDQG